MRKVGIIGGSGLYEMKGFKNVKEVKITTPFGKPSDNYICGTFEGVSVVFLPRHSRGHCISPSEINYRANIFGMKKFGVSALVSVSACGSLKEELKPMDFVIPDQFIDRTARPSTFFAKDIIAHVGFAEPVCAKVSHILYESARALNIPVHKGGTYLNMEGPQFSSKAESYLYRHWNLDIIGMTNATEAKLAREAEIAYATLAAVTDYDCWHPTHGHVTVDMIIANLLKNVDNAKKILAQAIPQIARIDSVDAENALEYAIVTDRKKISPKVKKDLKILIGKYIK